jgi:hypothetical protein
MTPGSRSLFLSYPYPLSGVALETLTLADRWAAGEAVPNLPFDVCRALGLLLRMNAAIAVAALAASSRELPELNSEVITTLRTPADGSWFNLTQRLVKGLQVESPLFASLGEALNWRIEVPPPTLPGKNGSEEGDEDKTTKKGQQAQKKLVGQLITQLIKYRNTIIHGDRMNDQAHAEAVAKLRAVLEAHAFYKDYVLLVRDEDRWLDCGGPAARWLEGDHQPAWWTDDVREAFSDLPPLAPTFVDLEDPSERLMVSGLLHYASERKGVRFDDLFFLNRGSADAAEYIAYRFEGHADGEALGSYERFRELISKLPAPPIPKEKRLEFDGLAEFHAQRFVGRRDVLEEIDNTLSGCQIHRTSRPGRDGQDGDPGTPLCCPRDERASALR